MATVREITLAERLVASLEESGLKLVSKVIRDLKRSIVDPTVTREDMKEIVSRSILQAAGENAPLMRAFLIENAGLLKDASIDFADPNVRSVYIEAGLIVDDVFTTGDFTPAQRSNGVLSDYVMTQVDDTQNLLALGILTGAVRWRVHTESGACDFCLKQAQEYSGYGGFQRHKYCKCVKVRA